MTIKPHIQRVLTSFILLPVLGWAIFSGDPILSIALALAAGVGLLEFFAMFWPDKEKLVWKIGGILFGTGLIWAPLSIGNGALASLSFFAAALFFLVTYARGKTDSFWDCQLLLFGILYLPLMLRLFRPLETTDILFVLLGTFATDTGAFYVGCHFGKRKIWPAISPKKTWAGSFGGLGLCVLLCAIFGAMYGQHSILAYALIGAAMNIAAQFGDFFESALKRWRNIKDSGKILPGHGGILDRIDSLLFVLPVYYSIDQFCHFFG